MWCLGQIRCDSVQDGRPILDEDAVRRFDLDENTPAPNLEEIRDTMPFHLSLSKGKMRVEPSCFSVKSAQMWVHLQVRYGGSF